MQMCHHHTISLHSELLWKSSEAAHKSPPPIDDDDDGSRRTQSNCLRPRRRRGKKSLEVWSSPDDKLFSLARSRPINYRVFIVGLQQDTTQVSKEIGGFLPSLFPQNKNMVIFVCVHIDNKFPCKSLIWKHPVPTI